MDGEYSLDADCLNFTSTDSRISDEEGKSPLPSTHHEESEHVVDEKSEGSSDTDNSEKEDPEELIGFNLQVKWSKFRFISTLSPEFSLLEHCCENSVAIFESPSMFCHLNIKNISIILEAWGAQMLHFHV